MRFLTREISVALNALQLLYTYNRRLPSTHIIDSIQEPHEFTSKVLSRLREHGFITATRGPGGGFMLSPLAEHQTLGAFLTVYRAEEMEHRRLIPGRASDIAYCVMKDAIDGVTLKQLFGGEQYG